LSIDQASSISSSLRSDAASRHRLAGHEHDRREHDAAQILAAREVGHLEDREVRIEVEACLAFEEGAVGAARHVGASAVAMSAAVSLPRRPASRRRRDVAAAPCSPRRVDRPVDQSALGIVSFALCRAICPTMALIIPKQSRR
jgi:hypothetical protein